MCAVAGNGPLPITARNAAYAVQRAGLGSVVPVYGGEAVPVSPGAPAPDVPRDVHGPDALGGLYQPDHPPVTMGEGVDALVRHAARRPPAGGLALGPLTNVACALERSPDLLAGLGRMVVMGGAFGDGEMDAPGPEFNWRTDPVAADRVCASRLALDVVPIDITGQILFTRADAERLAAAPGGGFAGELLMALLDLRIGPVATGCVCIHDAVAAVLAVEPGLATWHAVSLQVQRSGERRGSARMGAPGEYPGRARLATAIDAERTHAAILDGLLSPTGLRPPPM